MDDTRLFIFGLDGATWNVIEPLMQKGDLPNFKKVYEKGAHGNLNSTIPPMTCPAWACMLTGMRKHRLGVEEFFTKDPDGLGRELSHLKWSGWKTLDKVLSSHGKRSALVNIPTVVPWKTNGIVVTGPIWGADDSRLAYPVDLNAELLMDQFKVRIEKNAWINDDASYMDEINELTLTKFELMERIFRYETWDLAFFSLYYIDQVQHMFLSDMEKGGSRSGHLRDHMILLDRILGEIMDMIGEDHHLMIVSDHGHQNADTFVDLNSFLHKEGLLDFKEPGIIGPLSRKSSFYEAIDSILIGISHLTSETIGKLGNGGIMKKVTTLNSIFQERWSEKVDFRTQIDLERSSVVNITHGGLYILDRKKVDIDHLKKKLGDLRYNGRPVVSSVLTREEVHGMDPGSRYPDLTLLPQPGFKWKLSLRNPPGRTFFSHKVDSEHRVEGIFMLYGKDVRPGAMEDLTIYDICPISLFMMDCPIPAGLDGTVRHDLFKKGGVFDRKERMVSVDQPLKESIRSLVRKGKLRL